MLCSLVLHNQLIKKTESSDIAYDKSRYLSQNACIHQYPSEKEKPHQMRLKGWFRAKPESFAPHLGQLGPCQDSSFE